jgi:hypothetical protein
MTVEVAIQTSGVLETITANLASEWPEWDVALEMRDHMIALFGHACAAGPVALQAQITTQATANVFLAQMVQQFLFVSKFTTTTAP